MSDAAVVKDPCALEFVPNHFKTKRMCKRVVEGEPEILGFVPDNFNKCVIKLLMKTHAR